MVKKILQDVLPPGTRSIRRIPIERDSVAKKTLKKIPEAVSRPPRVTQSRTGSTKSASASPVLDDNVVRGGRRKVNYPRVVLWVMAIVSALFLLIIAILFFSSATVKVTPKSESILVGKTFVAKKDPLVGELGYALMTLTKEGEEVVPGTPGKKVEKRAIGNIILYNNFNSYPRKFLADTRLLAGNGKIYKLQSTVTIPGRTKVDGKIVPGSVQARVYAEKPGLEYNILLTDLMGDFKVVAFTGDPQYETFYGRQKTDIAGGIVTTTFTVQDSVAQAVRTNIRASLKEQIIKEATAQKPADFVLYHDAPLFTFESLPLVSKDNSNVRIIEKVIFNGILFKRGVLADTLANTTSKTLAGIPVEAQELDALVFGLKNKKENISLATNQFSFTLTGTTTLVAKIFPEKIAKDLIGKRSKEFSNVIAEHKEIHEALAQMNPFWSPTFPDSIEKIEVVTQ
ncbi:hypothetical protein EPO17_02415 [Patescibacteria group bacterium]|nr:MAG: hypothetical protein EPO17_02415 [Patescibacteria group bacterium]